MWWPTELEMVTARQFLAKDKIAVDVGANVGLFTAVLARHSKRVIAFEPNPSLARHLAEVAPRNCEVIAKAVSDREGMTTLRVPVADGIAMDALATISTANRFETEARATAFATHEVPTITLDQILLPVVRGGDRVAFINIDVEGHESAVLKGGEGLIAAERPVLLVELEYRHGAQVEDVFDWLKARRYVPRVLADGENLAAIDPAGLRALQDGTRLSRRLAGDRHAGYVNNVFFLPEN
jgi:FkbM family methyltransferase